MTSERPKPPKSDKPRRRPGRVPTSCAECRRLKLRCDRNIPCGKCVERGCGSICPDGSLASGRKNRLVLANTEELHDRIEHLCARIRDLENGLRDLQTSVTSEPHPLLASHLVQLKSSDFYPPTQPVNGNAPPVASTSASAHSSPTSIPVAVSQGTSPASTSTPPAASDGQDSDKSDEENFIDAFGTLTLGADGESSFLGKTARSEYLIRALAKPAQNQGQLLPRISRRISELSCGDEAHVNDELVQEVYNMLPPLSEAIRLCEIYLEQGKVLWIGMPRNELIDDIMAGIYRADRSSSATQSYHALALLFAVFALGSLFDANKPPYSVDAQEYYHLARAAFGFSPTSEAPTLKGIQSLVHMAQYKELADWEALGSNTAWTLAGLGVKLSYSIGLHVDSRRWGLSAEASQRRNLTFWMVFIVDSWTSFQFGRPPSVSLAYADCPLPAECDEIMGPDGPEMSFNLWAIKFTRVMHKIMTTVYGAKMPSYSAIVGLDKEVRDFHVPGHLRWSCLERPDSTKALQRWFVLYLKETTLLNLHRAYFTQALSDHAQPEDLYKHKYFPSVMATYRSAWRLTQSLTDLWPIAPMILSRLTLAWSQGLSAAIVMCILVTRSPLSKMTEPALAELDQVANLYEQASSSCRSAGNLAETIQTLRRKAHEAISNTQSPRTSHLSPEELDRLGGGTHLISSSHVQQQEYTPPTQHQEYSPQSPMSSMPTQHSHVDSQGHHIVTSPASMPSSSSSHTTPSPIAHPITPPPLSNHMHPTVIEDMRSLDVGALRASFFDMPSDPYAMQMHHQQDMELHQQELQQQGMAGVEFTNDPNMFGQQSHMAYFQQPVDGGDSESCLPPDPLQQQQQQQHHHQQQHQQQGGMGPMMGYGQPPMLDATWHSFVEQLGF